MHTWIQIILLFILYIGVIFYTVNYNKLFRPTKKIIKFLTEPKEETYVDGVWVSHFEFNKENPTILFCHGNSGNVSNRNYMIELCKMSNINLVLFDYSGYGKSKGDPRTRKILKDGEKVLNWTLQKVPEDKLIIWGESLGGSVASYLASHNKCSKLILFATFASLNHLAFEDDKNNPWWKRCVLSFLNIFVHPLPTKEWVGETKVPTLIVHSKDDELISIRHARMMENIDPKRIKLMEIQGGHGTPKMCKNEIKKLFEFCGVKTDHDIDFCLGIFDSVGKEIWVE
jgi:predicted alpha/beta-fold hydrolase